MPKLNQIVAVVTGKKSKAEKLLTDVHHGWKPERISGISRVYSPVNEDGERFPEESKRVQARVGDTVKRLCKDLADFWDVVATQENGNTLANSDIVVDGISLVPGVPIGTLLFLEKRLTDLRTFVQKIPTLSTDREWEFDKNSDCFRSRKEETTKTQKVPEVIVKYPATPEHPAQTELVMVDKVIGHWSTSHFSGAIPTEQQSEILDRIDSLLDSVKKAREEANSLEVHQVELGDIIMKYVFEDLIK